MENVTPMSSHSNTMLHFQKSAARIIMDAALDAPSTALLSELNILPFQERLAKLKAKMVSLLLIVCCPATLQRSF